MTGPRKDRSITRHRVLAVTGGTAAAVGPAIAGHQAASPDGPTASATAS